MLPLLYLPSLIYNLLLSFITRRREAPPKIAGNESDTKYEVSNLVPESNPVGSEEGDLEGVAVDGGTTAENTPKTSQILVESDRSELSNDSPSVEDDNDPTPVADDKNDPPGPVAEDDIIISRCSPTPEPQFSSSGEEDDATLQSSSSEEEISTPSELPSYHNSVEDLPRDDAVTMVTSRDTMVTSRYAAMMVTRDEAGSDQECELDQAAPTGFLTSNKYGALGSGSSASGSSRTADRKHEKDWSSTIVNLARKGQTVKAIKALQKCYPNSPDPHSLCCELLGRLEGYHELQRGCVDELQRWKLDNPDDTPILGVRLRALSVSYQCPQTLFFTLSSLFNFEDLPGPVVLNTVKEMNDIGVNNVKHSVLICTTFNVMSGDDLNKLLLTLLAFDRLQNVIGYLDEEQLIGFVRCLDSLIEPTSSSSPQLTSILSTLTSNYGYNRTTAAFRFSAEDIRRKINQIVKSQGLNLETCSPNIALSKTVTHLRAVLYNKYKKDKRCDIASLLSIVGDNTTLHRLLLKEVVTVYNDVEFGKELVIELGGMREEELPEELRVRQDAGICITMETLMVDGRSESRKLGKSEEGYLTLDETFPIVFIDSTSLLRGMKDHIIASGDTPIGYDSEWRFSGDGDSPPVSIIQISTPSACFLLDIPSLLQNTSETDLFLFASSLHSRIIIGYGLSQDLTKIASTWPSLGVAITTKCRIIDFLTAHKHIRISQPTSPGLSGLCKLLLGGELDKTCQISNWESRPLSADQIRYAALDSLVLHHLHTVLLEMFPAGELENLKDPKHNNTPPIREFRGRSDNPSAASELRVVVDVPLQGLGKKLRHIGVDCRVLEDGQDVDDCVWISTQENRIILSRDGNADRLAKLTDVDRVYKLQSRGNVTHQLAEIRSHFNLVVADEDLFSRCAICNSDRFVRLESDLAAELQKGTSSGDVVCEVWERRHTKCGEITVRGDSVTAEGTLLQFDKVKLNRFSENLTFWGCCECGKMYWDGCHLQHFKEKNNL
eukprot:sb/3461595/